MGFLLKLITWTIILISTIFIGNDIFYVVGALMGGEHADVAEVYFRIVSFITSMIVIYIFWNIYQFVLRKDYLNIKHIGIGLILEAVITGFSLFLPQDLYQMMEKSNFSDLQISLTYYLAYTPGSLAGGILGLFLLFVAIEKEKT